MVMITMLVAAAKVTQAPTAAVAAVAVVAASWVAVLVVLVVLVVVVAVSVREEICIESKGRGCDTLGRAWRVRASHVEGADSLRKLGLDPLPRKIELLGRRATRLLVGFEHEHEVRYQ